MVKLWLLDPFKRPTFAEIVEMMSNLESNPDFRIVPLTSSNSVVVMQDHPPEDDYKPDVSLDFEDFI
jgi:hypothetical protein